MRDRETGDDYERHFGHGNVSGNDGRYLLKWIMTLVGGFMLVLTTAGISWAVGESNRLSALEANYAAVNAKLDWLIDYARRTRGAN